MVRNNIVVNVILVSEENIEEYMPNFMEHHEADDFYILGENEKAGIGWTKENDGSFRPAQDHPSWIWDEEVKTWKAPKPYPVGLSANWDEDRLEWVTNN